MQVILYSTYSDKRAVNKTLGQLIATDCYIKGEIDLLNPVIYINGIPIATIAQCNYMYIPDYKRYYYAHVSPTEGNIAIIRGNIDVLMSYAGQIKSLSCVVTRQENRYNPFFVDSEIASRVNRKYVYKKVGSLPKQSSNVITVDGGAQGSE